MGLSEVQTAHLKMEGDATDVLAKQKAWQT
jgi:hypothetical protein